MNEELLYNQIYKRTEDFGRNEFIKELMRLEKQVEDLFKEDRELRIKLEHSIPQEDYRNMLHRKNEQLQQRDSAIEEVKEHIRYLRSLNFIHFCDIEPLEKILDKYKKEESE